MVGVVVVLGNITRDALAVNDGCWHSSICPWTTQFPLGASCFIMLSFVLEIAIRTGEAHCCIVRIEYVVFASGTCWVFEATLFSVVVLVHETKQRASFTGAL
jgi:hypothetical protein